MTEYSDEQVLENRRAWIEFLKDPKRKKKKGFLDDGHGARCCLGHGCRALGIHREVDADVITYGAEKNRSTAPEELIQLLGLWDDQGGNPYDDAYFEAGHFSPNSKAVYSLTEMNDGTPMRPQEIGEYLESVIEGGDSTPFRPIEKKEG